MRLRSPRLNACSVALLALVAASAAGDKVSRSATPECCPSSEDDQKRSYGPCVREPRKTLMQWSYGTSFEGGPPGPDEPLATDRPDFTEASVTVGRGVVQLETGYTYFFDEEGGERVTSNSFPEALLRVGVLAEWLELRVAWNYISETTSLAGVSNTNSGADDLYLGMKLGLTPQEGVLPEMALMPQMRVPTGAEGISSEEVLPGLNWLYGWDLNDFLSLGGSTQANRSVDETTSDGYLELAQSVTIGYSLAERIGAYTEWFVLAPHSADTARTETYFDAGLTFLLSNDVQLDVRAGVGLSEGADDHFVGTGASFRF
jgi:hypothetical protein